LTAQDNSSNAPLVAVISQRLARRFFGGKKSGWKPFWVLRPDRGLVKQVEVFLKTLVKDSIGNLAVIDECAGSVLELQPKGTKTSQKQNAQSPVIVGLCRFE